MTTAISINQLALESIGGAAATYFCISRELPFAPKIRLLVCWVMVAWLVRGELQVSNENLYTTLSIPTDATKAQVHQAYRQASKAYHPDKNPDMANSEVQFYKIKQAYDVLSHDTFRSNYNRFGDMYVETGDIDDKVVGVVVALSVVTQGLCFVIGYFCTFHKPLKLARQFFLIYNLGLLCLELHMRFVEDDSYKSLPVIGDFLPFERIMVLRRLFPSVLCLCMMLSNYLFVDEQAISIFLLRAVLATNRCLCDRVQTLSTVALPAAKPSSTAALKALASEVSQSVSPVFKARLPGANSSIGKADAKKQKLPDLQEPKTAGKKGAEEEVEAEANSGADGSKVSGWQNLTSSLTDKQKEQLTELLAQQAMKRSNSEGGINWNQILLWGGLVVFWLYFRS